MPFLPHKVIILRHGEKPGAAGDVDGVGNPNLSVRGYCRAAALAPSLPSIFGRPAFILATQASASSNRPVQTVTPLALATSLEIDSSHPDKDYQMVADDLAQNAKYACKTVVVCWHHGKIPELASAMGVTPPVQMWQDTVFDRYWVVTAGVKGSPQIVDLPQRLLYGDDAD